MAIFKKTTPNVPQGDLVASCFSTFIQIMNQVYTQGYAEGAHINVLGPIIFNSCHRGLLNRQAPESFMAAYRREKSSNPSLAESMEIWPEMSREVSDMSAARLADYKSLYEPLVFLLNSKVNSFSTKLISSEDAMDQTWNEGLKLLGGYLNELGRMHPQFEDLLAAELQILASSLVLFVADVRKSSLPKDGKDSWVLSMAGIVSLICALTAQGIDENT